MSAIGADFSCNNTRAVKGFQMVNSLIKAAVHSVGLDLKRYDSWTCEGRRLFNLLNLHKIDLVFDIGANIGQFARSARSSGYNGRIVSFEPLSSAWTQLKKNSQSDKMWEVAPRMAIGDADADVKMHVAGNSVSSSILDMLESHKRAAPNSAYVDSETTPLHRLDSVAMDYVHPDSRTFLKIDTQGFESQVIEGAKGVLSRAIGLHLEVSFVPLYEGQMLFPTMLSTLKSMGFEMWDVFPVFLDRKTLRSLQGDAIFIRA